MMDGFVTEMRELTLEAIIVRIILAVLVGGVIGLERERKNQPAGLRTYILVCLGACLVMMTNQYICRMFEGGDPSRLGAQVISGIGFLGAGTILVTRNYQVRGLTTAAGLWTSACIGVAIGIGFYEGAVITGLTLLFIMFVFKWVDTRVHLHSPYLRLYVNFDSNAHLNQFMELCRKEKMQFRDMQITKSKNVEDGTIAIFTIKNVTSCDHAQLIQRLAEYEGIRFIEELQG